MIPLLRKEYNANFSEKVYKNFINDLNASKEYPCDYRICETPLFLSDNLKDKLLKATEDIITQLKSEEFIKRSMEAVPAEIGSLYEENHHPAFLQIDFAVCKEDGNYLPKLIELQAFPTTFCYQAFLEEKYREYFSIPEYMNMYFSNMNKESYLNLLREILLKNYDPENVILLEVEPYKQKTRIDFVCTKEMMGIETADITEVLKKGKKLYYKKDGNEIPIKRIYNRVVYDELVKKKIDINFKFNDDLDVEWADHPSWFYRISKHSLPCLKGEFTADAFLLNELDKYPDDLENYILKPLYSFSGYGFKYDITKDILDKIPDKSNYILQKKIEYAQLVETPDGFSKVEIRIIIFWKDHPIIVNNLTRMSKGKMMGVDYNKDKTWVGSTIAYHK